MKRIIILTLAIFFTHCLFAQKNVSLSSPDGKLKFALKVEKDAATYSVTYKNNTLINNSLLGFNFDSGEFMKKLKINKPIYSTIDETYDLLVGKVSRAHNYCKEVIIPFEEKDKPNRKINLIVRAFNDGIAFRYEFPEQDGWKSYVMYDEYTQFNPVGNPKLLALFFESYINTHEWLYTDVLYADVEKEEKKLIDMPVLLQYPNNVYMAITEAAVVNYAGMYLSKENGAFKAKLSPHIGQEKIKVVMPEFPHRTPWRVMMVSDKIGTLIESTILTSLNEPCKIDDVSWIKPGKTTFTWWNGNVVPDTTFMPGNNFETNKYYIDFAARNNIDFHSIYGYAETPWYFDDRLDFGNSGPNADVTRPVSSLDMQRICDYAKSKGVGIHFWVNWKPLYKKLDEAFAQYQKWGVKGLMVDFMDRDDQEMITIQEEILKSAAKHHLFIQFHGSSKPSGLHRTYPNEFTREGALNYEGYKWARLVNADHDIDMPFTRLLAGPTDYHLGGFRALPRSKFINQYINPYVTSTRCHMLAMYVVLESYLGMVCDTPEAYEGQPGFEFLQKIPTTWNDTKVLNGEIKQYVTIARKNGNDWYVGAINNSQKRDISIPLNFLEEGKYQIEIYTDSKDADEYPNNLVKEVKTVTKTDVINLTLAAEGGMVMHISPL